MEVNIEIERTSESLDQSHRTGLRGVSGKSRLLDQVGRYGPGYDPQHPAHQLRTAGKQEPQLVGEAQHPLAYGLFR